VYRYDHSRLAQQEKLVSEELGRELTPKEKFYLAMADACSPRSPKPLILCIEDNVNQLRLRKAVLEKAGYDVVGASTGPEALEIMREAPICLVLSDHMLSGTTGAALAREIKQVKQEVPVILHSGTVPDSMQNVDGFISKSEPVPTFLAMINDFVKRYLE
jgi:CheY-like chemotaxis protein